MKVQFLQAAADEAYHTYIWYEQRQSGLGQEFANELDRVLDKINRFPELFSVRKAGFRRALLARFPYAVWYRLVEEVILVYAVAHTRRTPGYWIERGR